MNSWRLLNLANFYQIVALALVSLAAYALYPVYALGVFIGAAFGVMNFWALKEMVRRGFSQQAGAKPKMAYVVLLGFKMVTALAVMAGLLIVLRLHPLAFGVGLATTLLGFAGAMVHVTLAPTAS